MKNCVEFGLRGWCIVFLKQRGGLKQVDMGKNEIKNTLGDKMLKGAQRRMIVLKTQDSRVFEEAYFVMRTDTSASGEDMVSEANRIIENCLDKRRSGAGRARAKVIAPICAFIGGTLFGGGLTLLVTMIA